MIKTPRIWTNWNVIWNISKAELPTPSSRWDIFFSKPRENSRFRGQEWSFLVGFVHQLHSQTHLHPKIVYVPLSCRLPQAEFFVMCVNQHATTDMLLTPPLVKTPSRNFWASSENIKTPRKTLLRFLKMLRPRARSTRKRGILAVLQGENAKKGSKILAKIRKFTKNSANGWQK